MGKKTRRHKLLSIKPTNLPRHYSAYFISKPQAEMSLSSKRGSSLLYSVYAIAILNGQQILTVVRIHACILFKRWKKICNVMLDGTSDKNDNSVRIYLPHSVFFYVFCRRAAKRVVFIECYHYRD